tara:strand:- start:714 stop:1094 length:381 start_codon:yes stop_codon:yes gene_type:complete
VTRLLLAEDDHDLRDLTTMMLGRQGLTVTAVADGGAARAHVRSGEHFDVLVLDLDMPVCTGIEVAQEARAVGYTGRIILWTGWDVTMGDHDLGRLGVRVLGKQDVATLRAVVMQSAAGPPVDAAAG